MSLKSILIIFGIIGVCTACTKPNLNQNIAIAWIDSKNSDPLFDITGSWQSTAHYMAGGWGNGSFFQKSGRINGTLGPYSIEGRISGKQIFMLILSGNRVDYTAILEPTTDGGIAGVAVSRMLADSPEARLAERMPIHLVRPPKD